jgi:hypothetical protein
MRILLTGASGQVGGALLPRLSGLGTVIATDRARIDLGKPEGLAAALDAIAPDLIIILRPTPPSTRPRTSRTWRCASMPRRPAPWLDGRRIAACR